MTIATDNELMRNEVFDEFSSDFLGYSSDFRGRQRVFSGTASISLKQ
jgi:hypothetical protein